MTSILGRLGVSFRASVGDVGRTLEHAVAAMFALVEATLSTGSRELELVLAQDSLVAPARPFPAVKVA